MAPANVRVVAVRICWSGETNEQVVYDSDLWVRRGFPDTPS